jgi:RNase P/RNase MRP subunit p29
VLREGEDHAVLEESVAPHELLGGAVDVAVVVRQAHAGEAGDVSLESDHRSFLTKSYQKSNSSRKTYLTEFGH